MQRPITSFAVYLLAFCIIAISATATAKTFIVDSVVDQTDQNINDGDCVTVDKLCTLRAAIQQANELPGADTIQVPPGLYLLNTDLTPSAARDDKNFSGDLDILDAVEIIGMGLSPVQTPTPVTEQITVIDGLNFDRVFDVRTHKIVKFSRIVVQNGKCVTSHGAGIRVNTPRPGLISWIFIDDALFQRNICKLGNGGALSVDRGAFLR